MENILTIDVEEWHQAIRFPAGGILPSGPDRIEQSLPRLLEILDRHQVRVTAFFLGEVAQRFPHLVQRTAAAGHEIACHGYSHVLLDELGKEHFREELRKARTLLEDLAGQPIAGFRAPWFSISRHTLWAMEILADEGFKYDASLFPLRTTHYGMAATFPYPHRIATPAGAMLLELPPATFSLGPWRIPTGGGFYLRNLPARLIRQGLEQANRRGWPGVFYIHPWEVDPVNPAIRLPFDQWVIHNLGQKRASRSLENLLAMGRFGPINRFLAGLNQEEDRGIEKLTLCRYPGNWQ